MCFSCFNLITLEVCKSEMWKSGKCLGCLLEGGTWDNSSGYESLASESPYPIIVYSVANYRPHLSHFWANQ